MKLVGLVDSPFLRRLLVVLTARNVPFAHEPISVFRHMERYREINPVIKTPTLVTDDGVVLMESSVIFHWLESLAGPFLPAEPAARARAARLTALGLIVMEKAVQMEYERKRPEAIRHAPWFERVKAQLATALGEIEIAFATGAPPDPLEMDGASVVCGWGFTAHITPGDADAAAFPRLAAYAAAAEALPAYRRWPIEG
jgi:glutathione S-transferase